MICRAANTATALGLSLAAWACDSKESVPSAATAVPSAATSARVPTEPVQLPDDLQTFRQASANTIAWLEKRLKSGPPKASERPQGRPAASETDVRKSLQKAQQLHAQFEQLVAQLSSAQGQERQRLLEQIREHTKQEGLTRSVSQERMPPLLPEWRKQSRVCTDDSQCVETPYRDETCCRLPCGTRVVTGEYHERISRVVEEHCAWQSCNEVQCLDRAPPPPPVCTNGTCTREGVCKCAEGDPNCQCL